MIDSSGNRVGVVELEQTASGVRVTVQVAGIPAGTHGIHFHAVGKCDTPDFMSAGGHFNPTSKKHGLDSPDGPHAGDLPNLSVNVYTATTDRISLTPGPATLFDADGTALVIHANPDDQVTDPAGNSGGRIACAVITQQAPSLPNTGAGGGAPSPWAPAALLGLATLALTVGAGLAATARRAPPSTHGGNAGRRGDRLRAAACIA